MPLQATVWPTSGGKIAQIVLQIPSVSMGLSAGPGCGE